MAAQTEQFGRDILEITDAPALNDLQSDIQTLKDDLSRVTSQVADIMAAKGATAWEQAKSNIDGVVSEATQKSKDAANAVREIGDSVADTIEDSVKTKPYTTLALAVGLGFICGLTWRR
jgi:ElaB/YqjD/DUF883 family membrane-anchored ribosome-binding protein